jgi:hypothetical protein
VMPALGCDDVPAYCCDVPAVLMMCQLNCDDDASLIVVMMCQLRVVMMCQPRVVMMCQPRVVMMCQPRVDDDVC